MTSAPPEFGGALDDAELAMAAAHGDRAAFAAIYDRYANRLYDFCAGMLRDTDAAADCVQDVFVDAASQLGALRDPSRLRPWLYAVARNQALARIRARRREMPTDELPEFDSGEPDLATLAARSELADLIADACGGLSERDRTVFELTYRHGLDGTELADALGVSHTNANTLAGRLRDGVERSLGALLVCRGVKTDPACCPELALLLADWDGTFTVLMRKRAARHIDGCSVCEEERRRRVNPVALLGGVPVFLPAPASLRERTLPAASQGLPAATQPPEATPPPQALPTPHLSPAQGRHARAALIAVFVILGIAGVAQLAGPLLLEDQRVDPVSEVVEATTEAPGSMTVFNGPASLAPSVPSTTAEPTEPVQGPTTTVITTASTTIAPTRTTTQTPTTTSTKPSNSFSPSRAASSTERTTQTQTRTSTSTSASTSTSTSPPPPPTTTTSDPIE